MHGGLRWRQRCYGDGLLGSTGDVRPVSMQHVLVRDRIFVGTRIQSVHDRNMSMVTVLI